MTHVEISWLACRFKSGSRANPQLIPRLWKLKSPGCLRAQAPEPEVFPRKVQSPSELPWSIGIWVAPDAAWFSAVESIGGVD